MLKPHLIFCHGFGLTPAYWKHLAPLFTDYPITLWDLGYYAASPYIEIPKDRTLIGIGHSLGMNKLLASKLPLTKLIGLNAFTSFLGYAPELQATRHIELQQMQKQFRLKPERTLKAFYQRAGIDDIPNATLNHAQLLQDIDQLNLEPNIPESLPKMLIIGTEDDVIVPPALIQDNCNQHPNIKSKLLPYGKHALGLELAHEIYPIVSRFIHEP